MFTTDQIQIRDPFVVACENERKYYLYGSTDPSIWDGGPAVGFDMYVSNDLTYWEGPFAVFRRPEGFWSDREFWAPEIHVVNGTPYMLATFKADGFCRGTQILIAEQLTGPFRPHSNGAVTPDNWECLDGTLFIDEDNTPWMVFCHEWVQVRDGEICAIRLSNDLRHPIGNPMLLFKASQAPWSRVIGKKSPEDRVTDGPFLYRTSKGDLLMIWSSFGDNGYAVGIARSETGRILGPWHQLPDLLFSQDGGHAMLFRRFDGQLMVSLHQPNHSPQERPVFLPVSEQSGTLTLSH